LTLWWDECIVDYLSAGHEDLYGWLPICGARVRQRFWPAQTLAPEWGDDLEKQPNNNELEYYHQIDNQNEP